jgi:hypothetical protein
LLITLPVFERAELEFQRRYDTLEALLRLGRTSDVPNAIAHAKESASRFIAKRQKEEAIDALYRLYER